MIDIFLQVAPAELEAVLLSHTQIADAGVVGLPNPNAGELPMAWVVLRPGATLTEVDVQNFVAGRFFQQVLDPRLIYIDITYGIYFMQNNISTYIYIYIIYNIYIYIIYIIY